MFDAVFSPGPIRNYRDTIDSNVALGKRFNALVREHGVFKSDNKIYVSLGHDEADVAHAITAFREAAGSVANLGLSLSA